MTKFFIPVAESKSEEERVYLAIKRFLTEETGASISSRRIYRLTYQEGPNEILAEVGMEHPENGEQVHAIFYEENRKLYYICTTERGVARGVPILVTEKSILSSEDFEV